MARCLDFNDVYSSVTGGHPSDSTLGVFAAVEAAGGSGHDFVVGVNTAYEVFACLADEVALRATGWDQTVLVAVATAAGVCAALGESYDVTAHALSLAVTACHGLRISRSGELSAWKGCATAFAVRGALSLTALAAGGMSGPSEPFRGAHGFVDQVAGQMRVPRPRLRRDGLSAIQRTAVKLLPVETSAQGIVEAVLSLHPEVLPNEIEAIRISAHEFVCDEIGGGRGDAAQKWDPQTRETADHSLPYLVAVALVDGRVDLDSFRPLRIRDPELRPLMDRIRIDRNPLTSDAPPDRSPAHVVIELGSGEVITRECLYFAGHPCRPAPDESIDAKFLDLVGARLPDTQANELLGMLRHVDTLTNVEGVASLLRAVEHSPGGS
jgi:2-methylcitrate dehydratase